MPKTEEQKARDREYQKRYYQERKEARLASAKEYRETHKEQLKESREERKEELNAYNRTYYQEHKDAIQQRTLANQKIRFANETPEQRALRLEKMRLYDKRRKYEKQLPDPSTLPPPPEEWMSMPTPVQREAERVVATASAVAAAAPPPPPERVAPAVTPLVTGAGAPLTKSAAMKMIATLKNDIGLLNRNIDYVSARGDNAKAMELIRERNTKMDELAVLERPFRKAKQEKAEKKEQERQDALRRQREEEERTRPQRMAELQAQLDETARTHVIPGTMGGVFQMMAGTLFAGMRTAEEEARAQRKKKERDEKEEKKIQRLFK